MLQTLEDFEKDKSDFHADVVVVGAGAVGTTLAVDLARSGMNVVLLEAGPKSVTSESQKYFETATYEGARLEGLHLGRFRALGGTTHFWGGQLVPMAPIVFESRPWVDESATWPIRYDEVSPYFEKAYKLLGMEAVIQSDQDVLASLGETLPPLPESLDFFFTRWTPESNFSRLFQSEIANLSNLRVVTEAPVVGFVSDASGVSIKKVVTVDTKGNRIHIDAKQVVLANGTVEIARLLMMDFDSGEKPIWHSYPWLGRGFMDHVDCVVGDVKPVNKKKFHNLFDNVVLRKFKYQPKLKLSEVAQRDDELLSIACHFIFRSSISEHLDNAKIFLKALLRGRLSGSVFELPKQLATLFKVGFPMVVRYLRYRRIYNPADQGIQLRVTSEQRLMRENRLVLREEKDSLGMPLIKMQWSVDPAAMTTISKYAKIVKGFLESNNIASVSLDPRVVRQDVEFLTSIDDANHHMGMARMSITADDGVVDSNLRVHGVSNLYVAGAAVYPSSGFENPTFTAIALGLRLSNYLSARP